MSNKKYEAIVIGAGLGGLVSAAFLAKKGIKVLVLEKEDKPGGYQIYFKRKGFTIEPSLHIIAEAGEGGAINRILAELGIEKDIAFSRLDPVSDLIFSGEKISIPQNCRNYIDLLKEKFPGEANGIENVFEHMKNIYQGLVTSPEPSPIVQEYGAKPFQSLLDKFIKNKNLQTIVGAYAAYFGLPLSRISCVMMSAFTTVITEEGGYMPAGGVKNLVGLLEKKIYDFGGEIRMKSPAKKIMIKNGKVAGVVLDNGDQIDCDRVISNADAGSTFFDMVGEENLPSDFASGVRKIELSYSAFNVFLGVKSEGLSLKEMGEAILVFPDYDLEGQYQAMNKGELEKANFFISIPTKTNPNFAPPGHDILIIGTSMPYQVEGISWKEKKGEYTGRLIDLAEKVIPGLQNNITMTESATPNTLCRYTGNARGAIGGWAYTPEADANKPLNKTPVEDCS